jgi:diguanylate cyclase (GGDEF)-like protein
MLLNPHLSPRSYSTVLVAVSFAIGIALTVFLWYFRAGQLTYPVTLTGLVVLILLLAAALAAERAHSLQRSQSERRLRESFSYLQEQIERAEVRNNVSEVMAELSGMLQASISEVEALRVLSRYAAALFPGTSGAIHLLRASGDVLEHGAHWGNPGEHEESFHPDQCWALRLGRPYLFVQGGRHPACPHLGEKATCSLCVPLTSQGETLGVMSLLLAGVAGIHETPPFDMPLSGSVGDLGALAIANIRLREKLRNQSIRDGLTDLFNRRFLTENLALLLPRVEREGGLLSVVMIDLDHFKQFNDRYGHVAGDWLLVAFSHFLKNTMRRGDLACRFGGEEFVLVLPGAGAEAAKSRMEAVLADWLAFPLSFEGEVFEAVTFSAGIATRLAFQLDGDDLIRSADEALYTAKQLGRNQVTSMMTVVSKGAL